MTDKPQGREPACTARNDFGSFSSVQSHYKVVSAQGLEGRSLGGIMNHAV